MSKQWNAAVALCTRYDMDLVTFDSSTEDDYFASLVTSQSYWVGVTDSELEGTFRNYNNYDIISGSLLKWNAGEPNNNFGGADEDCVMAIPNAYNDVHCTRIYLRVACERRIPQKLATRIEKALAPEPAFDKFKYVASSGKCSDIFCFKYLRTMRAF